VADLPHYEHVECRTERESHAGADRHTPARQGEDARPGAAGSNGQPWRSPGYARPFWITGAFLITAMPLAEELKQRGAEQRARLRSVAEGGRA
jgi:hypothetical protein